MELQETLLQVYGMVLIIYPGSAQGIKTMTDAVAVVHRAIKVPGGIFPAMVQTSMLSTMVDHTLPMRTV